ncbi:tRNA glutamyl-Q(34) synthetase GluQRS [Haliea sp. E1-2-M8]|uniref:tRNA glutamyl-Q(34) synthetase GluQRS n=1 Tax=Haliea sp. E1-2-M8 TaxID=3064706 RepID=UPI0027223C12|nr:tRNA glutamyl-Q(34) synthetase GluQRS [Haliea sp. E1-2-M8]MDO8861585.1 tRNA glutamyl-Q(34) synthetase GluQRS [Haliea sp. E1-2-M8]
MAPTRPGNYRGRFAPSPTGPLHLGSLVAALASLLHARSAGGLWLLRIEDIDPPREQPGATAAILHSLVQHGLQWDGDILWQSRRSAAYDAALAALRSGGHLFACACSRRELGPEGSCQRDCRSRQAAPDGPSALRVAVPADFESQWLDPWQGPQHWPLGRQLTDFVVRRKDGLYAYQLAVVVDDAYQEITDVVRGADLLDSTPRQHLLQQLLGYPRPRYAHIPVLADNAGQKLSKQNLAPALDDAAAPDNLRLALHYLGQPAPPAGVNNTRALLDFAVAHWSPLNLVRAPAVTAGH